MAAIERQLREVVEQMRRGQIAAGGVEELSASALEALHEIVETTEDATNRARRIWESATEQDEAFERLRQRMESIASISGQNRSDAEDVAQRAQEAERGLTDLETATRELESVAAVLQELARRLTTVD